MVSSTFKTARILASVSATALLLGACGGGGGGGGVAARSFVGRLLPQDQASSLTSAFLAEGGKKVSVEVSNGRVVSTDSVDNVTLNYGTFRGQRAIELNSTDGTTTGAVGRSSGRGLGSSSGKAIMVNRELRDSSYGIVVTASGTGTDNIGAYHVGERATSMPTSASATYTGKLVGVVVQGGRTEAVSGDMSMTADFGARSVTGRGSNITGVNRGSTGTDILINGRIAGSTYAGDAHMVRAGTNTSEGAVTRSNMTGGFYGSGASETAGAVTVTQNVRGQATTIVGAFGGER